LATHAKEGEPRKFAGKKGKAVPSGGKRVENLSLGSGREGGYSPIFQLLSIERRKEKGRQLVSQKGSNILNKKRSLL